MPHLFLSCALVLLAAAGATHAASLTPLGAESPIELTLPASPTGHAPAAPATFGGALMRSNGYLDLQPAGGRGGLFNAPSDQEGSAAPEFGVTTARLTG